MRIVETNRPLERQAQLFARAQVRAKKASNPNLEAETLTKIKFKALGDARQRVGIKSQDNKITFTAKEWNAIQAGAITNNKLRQLLDKSDLDQVRRFSTPRAKVAMTSAKVARAQSLLSSGGTRAEVASALGVSVTTLDRALNGEGDD